MEECKFQITRCFVHGGKCVSEGCPVYERIKCLDKQLKSDKGITDAAVKCEAYSIALTKKLKRIKQLSGELADILSHQVFGNHGMTWSLDEFIKRLRELEGKNQ